MQACVTVGSYALIITPCSFAPLRFAHERLSPYVYKTKGTFTNVNIRQAPLFYSRMARSLFKLYVRLYILYLGSLKYSVFGINIPIIPPRIQVFLGGSRHFRDMTLHFLWSFFEWKMHLFEWHSIEYIF